MTAKADALAALGEVRRMLAAPGALASGLAMTQVRATLDYAVTCVERIEELKRMRRTPKEKKP